MISVCLCVCVSRALTFQVFLTSSATFIWIWECSPSEKFDSFLYYSIFPLSFNAIVRLTSQSMLCYLRPLARACLRLKTSLGIVLDTQMRLRLSRFWFMKKWALVILKFYSFEHSSSSSFLILKKWLSAFLMFLTFFYFNFLFFKN